MTSQGLDAIERAAHEAVVAGAPGYADTLEALVAALLKGAAGFAPRATDGLLVLREERSETGYFAVGMVSLIEDQSREPVCVDLIFTPGGQAIASGTVRFGRAVGGNSRLTEDRLANALTAYPRETAQDLDWRFVFERSSRGWNLVPGQ
jgi:hypothetical protein